MRFFEFKLPEPGSELAQEIKSDLDELSDIVNQKPEIESKINAELQKILDLAKSESKKAAPQSDPFKKPENAFSKEPSIGQPNEAAFDESSTASSTDSIISALMKELENIVDKAKKKTLAKMVENLVSQAKKEAFSDLDENMSSLMSNLKQLPEVFSKIVSDEITGMLIKNEVEQPVVFQFLKDCASPERLIDMPAVVASPGPNAGSFVVPEKYRAIVQRLAKLKPQGSNAAAGKGELVLTLIGKGTVKPAVGDIVVDSKKIEVKASDISGSGVTDFALSSKKQNVQAARTVFVNAVNSSYGKPIFLDAEAKISKGGISGISSINKTHLSTLQPIFQKMGNSLVTKTFKEMFEKVGLPAEDIDEVLEAFNPDGTVDLEKYSKALVKSSFKQYQKNNKHDGLLTINVKNLSYTYTEKAEDFVDLDNIQVERLFDFRPNPSVFTSFKQTN